MSQTVEDLVNLGLSKAEAERVIKRKAKEAEKSEAAVATAEKRLPKAQADLDHASARQAHWAKAVEVAGNKVAKYTAIIAGEDVALPTEDEPEAEATEPEPEVEAKAEPKNRNRGRK